MLLFFFQSDVPDKVSSYKLFRLKLVKQLINGISSRGRRGRPWPATFEFVLFIVCYDLISVTMSSGEESSPEEVLSVETLYKSMKSSEMKEWLQKNNLPRSGKNKMVLAKRIYRFQTGEASATEDEDDFSEDEEERKSQAGQEHVHQKPIPLVPGMSLVSILVLFLSGCIQWLICI